VVLPPLLSQASYHGTKALNQNFPCNANDLLRSSGGVEMLSSPRPVVAATQRAPPLYS